MKYITYSFIRGHFNGMGHIAANLTGLTVGINVLSFDIKLEYSSRYANTIKYVVIDSYEHVLNIINKI
jgi:hypothetical protein